MFDRLIRRLLLLVGSHDWRPHAGASGLTMRRKVNGQWQYRMPSSDEERDYVEDAAW